jgi:hypothetical protein
MASFNAGENSTQPGTLPSRAVSPNCLPLKYACVTPYVDDLYQRTGDFDPSKAINNSRAAF